MEDIRQFLQDKIDKNPQFFDDVLSDKDKEHIINISISIINTRDKTGPKGGGLVHAIVANDLSDALGRADSVCLKSIKFLSYVNKHIVWKNY